MEHIKIYKTPDGPAPAVEFIDSLETKLRENVVRQTGQAVSVSQAKGDPAQLHSYALDGATYQKYDVWTEYETADDSLSNLSYELPFYANVDWSTDPERTFLRFTLIEFPQSVVTDLNNGDYSTWHVVGTPLNVVWSKGGNGTTWSADKCRSDITWYNSYALRYNSLGADQSSTMVNEAQWMRQAKGHQFLEYPLNEDGTPTGEEWSFTVTYTSGMPTSYNATKAVTEIGNGLKFTLKANETIHIDFEADSSCGGTPLAG